jgi:Domain of Unknown Function (DUF1080)
LNRREVLGGAGALLASAALPASLFAKSAKQLVWKPLFDGKSLNGWTFYQEGVGTQDIHKAVSIKNGVLHFLSPHYTQATAPPGHIATVDEWENYHLRLEFAWGERRWAPRAIQRRNSGILYHMGPERDRLFPGCVEFQVQEGDVGDAVVVNSLALQGPLLGGTPLWPNWIEAFPSTYQEPVKAGPYARQWHRQSGNFERLEGWNTLDLYAFGDQAAQLVNGRIVNTLFKMRKRDATGALVPMTKGRIALELEWAEVMFRNVMIRELDTNAIALIRKQGSD